VGAFLRKIGVEDGALRLDDGSGLSHQNRVTADALIRVLEYNWYGRNRDAFLATLAVGGQDGTLERRFKNGLRGRVFAKTGYIDTVGALSGYVRARDDQWYAFSILINNLPHRTNPKEAQEEIVKTICNIAPNVR
jgi:D-alanyl-D-alanine carboxypeptidase/D-alanyl-D-alanine-endopeptidase (penicillin-binding protein 4)